MKSQSFILICITLCTVDIFYSGETKGLACAEEVKVKVKAREKR